MDSKKDINNIPVNTIRAESMSLKNKLIDIPEATKNAVENNIP
jgi:hypothetical protein